MFLNIKNKSDIKKYLINMFAILIIYFIITQSASIIIQKTGINQNGLTNKNILWKFVCGLDYASKGQYSKKGELIFNDKIKEIDFILENLKMSLNNHIELAENKIIAFWQRNNYDWVLQNENINLFNKNMSKSELINIVTVYDQLLYGIILALLLIHLIDIIIKRHIKNKELLLILMVIINFFAYLVIEVQPRYSYTIKIFMYILASGGINYIINMLFYRKKI